MRAWIPGTSQSWFCGLALILLPATVVLGGDQTEKVRNDKVLVVEQTLAPGEALSLPGERAGVVVYLDAGSVETTPSQGKSRTEAVKRGDVVFQPPQSGTVKNAGDSALRIIWTEYLGKGSSETWGSAGLAPNYKVIFENQFGRVYDIQMAAGKSEPLHSHHDRVVICLSGAELEHILPDGRKETSALKTGEIAWRRGGTHVGHNLGKTDLWVIAIEPK
jgi:oxalate decarboxylase/phosphoglucose isomerase-like protein (cupin superfamily)